MYFEFVTLMHISLKLIYLPLKIPDHKEIHLYGIHHKEITDLDGS